MPGSNNKMRKNKSRATNNNKVGIPKGLVILNSIEQQNEIFNKKVDQNKSSSYYSLSFNYSDCF